RRRQAMTTATTKPRASLKARTAAELMMPNPVSIRDCASIADAVRFLTDKGFSAAPVINDRGRPVGVISRADIMVFDRERNGSFAPYFDDNGLPLSGVIPNGVVDAENVRVTDVMTPVVFTVGPEAAAEEAIEEMVRLRVHRLFVVDSAGTLVGVISALDV